MQSPVFGHSVRPIPGWDDAIPPPIGARPKLAELSAYPFLDVLTQIGIDTAPVLKTRDSTGSRTPAAFLYWLTPCITSNAPKGAATLGVRLALRDALPVEVGHLLDQMVILQPLRHGGVHRAAVPFPVYPRCRLIPQGIAHHGRAGAVVLSGPPDPPGGRGISIIGPPGPNGPAKPGRRSSSPRGPIGGIP